MEQERSLIRVNGKDPELEGLQRAKFDEAIRNLVTGTTPKDVIFQRPARGGLQVAYVPGWWFIQQLNALFGYLWDFEILEQDIGKRQVWV